MRKYRQAEVIFRFPSLHSELPSLSLSLSIYFSSYLLSHSLRDEKRRIDRKFLFGGGYLPVSVRRGDLCRCAPNPSLTPFNVNAITVLVVYPVQPSSISSFFLPFPFPLSLFLPPFLLSHLPSLPLFVTTSIPSSRRPRHFLRKHYAAR